MIDYDNKAIKNFLPLCGINVSPRQLDVGSEQHHYFYPPANVFPENALIQDTVNYFLHVKGNVKNRRVGILIQFAGERLVAFVVNLTEPKPDVVEAIKTVLQGASQPPTTQAILRSDLAKLFCALYAKVECVLLGLNPQNPSDGAIVNQIASLIKNAYHIQQIHVNFIPLAPQPLKVALFNDLLSVFKRGLFTPEAIKTINHQMPELSDSEKMGIMNQLREKFAKIREDDAPSYETIMAEATKLYRHLEAVKWRFQQKLPLNLMQYHPYKQTLYTATLTEEQLIQRLDIQILLSLVIRTQAVDILQLLTVIDEKVLTDLQAWEALVQTQLDKINKNGFKNRFFTVSTVLASMIYNSTLIPIGVAVVPTVMGSVDGPLKEYAQYGLSKVSKAIAYSFTMSDESSEHFSQAVVNAVQSDRASQLIGSLVGLYCTYLLGVNTLLRSFAFVALMSQVYRYAYTQHFDNPKAIVAQAAFKKISLHTLGRVVGLMMGIAEAVYMGQMIQLLVCAGGFLGSLSAAKLTEDLGRQPTDEAKTIAFISSMGGQQLGRAIVSLLLLTYFTLDARNQRRELFLEYFRVQAENNHIDKVDIQFSSWVFNLWNLMTGHDFVGISFSNATSAFFYNGNCDIGHAGMTCDPALPALENITHVPEYRL